MVKTADELKAAQDEGQQVVSSDVVRRRSRSRSPNRAGSRGDARRGDRTGGLGRRDSRGDRGGDRGSFGGGSRRLSSGRYENEDRDRDRDRGSRAGRGDGSGGSRGGGSRGGGMRSSHDHDQDRANDRERVRDREPRERKPRSGTAEGSNLLMRAMKDSNSTGESGDRKRAAGEDGAASEKRVRVGERLSGGGNKLTLSLKDRLGAPNNVNLDDLTMVADDEEEEEVDDKPEAFEIAKPVPAFEQQQQQRTGSAQGRWGTQRGAARSRGGRGGGSITSRLGVANVTDTAAGEYEEYGYGDDYSNYGRGGYGGDYHRGRGGRGYRGYLGFRGRGRGRGGRRGGGTFAAAASAAAAAPTAATAPAVAVAAGEEAAKTSATEGAAAKAGSGEGEGGVEGSAVAADPDAGAEPKGPTFEERQAADAVSVYVTGVHFAVDEEQLNAHFKDCGTITRSLIKRDRVTSFPKGSAYVQFENVEARDSALKKDQTKLRGRAIVVIEKMTFPDPAEGGGGGGGRGRGGHRGGRGGRFGGYRGGGRRGYRGGRGGRRGRGSFAGYN